MTTTLNRVQATHTNKDIFFEGNLVQSTQTDGVYLVTVPATGYSAIQNEDTFAPLFRPCV